MTVALEDVQAVVNATSDSDVTLLDGCLDAANEILTEYVTSVLADHPIPPATYDRALTAVTVEMFNQSKAPNGVLNQNYDFGNGEITSTPIRISTDPLRPAYKLLRLWMPIPVA